MRATKISHITGALAVAAIAACGSTPASTSSSSGTSSGSGVGQAQASGLGTPAASVNETDALTFAPTTSTVHVGDVVQWTDGGATPHNVTFDSQSALTSATMNQNDTWQVKFTTAGTYQYKCTFHPGMNGTVTVTQ